MGRDRFACIQQNVGEETLVASDKDAGVEKMRESHFLSIPLSRKGRKRKDQMRTM